MQRPTFTFDFFVIICSLIAIITLVEGYEVIILLHLGDDKNECEIWMEDYQRNFITYIPPGVDPRSYYTFYCHGQGQKNRIATLTTLDNSTAYWVHAHDKAPGFRIEKVRGGYNKDTCFDLNGDTSFKWRFDEHDYEECRKIRDGS